MQQSQFDHEALSLTPYILLTILDIHTLHTSLIHKLVNARMQWSIYHVSQVRSVRTYVRAGRPFLAVLIRVVADNKHGDVIPVVSTVGQYSTLSAPSTHLAYVMQHAQEQGSGSA